MEGGGLGTSEIVNSLYSRDFILRTLGNIEVDYPTIAVSYNAVVCRACIDGYDGAILLKCYTAAPTPLLAQYAEICRRRLLDNTSDDYALAAIATTLERLTFDESMFGCYLQEDGTLDVPFLK